MQLWESGGESRFEIEKMKDLKTLELKLKTKDPNWEAIANLLVLIPSDNFSILRIETLKVSTRKIELLANALQSIKRSMNIELRCNDLSLSFILHNEQFEIGMINNMKQVVQKVKGYYIFRYSYVPTKSRINVFTKNITAAAPSL